MKKTRTKIVTACSERLFFFVFVFICSTLPAFATQKAAATTLPDNKKAGTVAVVNGSEISHDDFNRELYRAERMVLDAGKLLTAPQVTNLRTQVLEGLVRQELLYQEAKKTTRVTDAEVTAELDKLKSQFKSDADFTKAVPVLRVQVERELVIRKYIDTVYASKAVVKDSDIRSYYDNNLRSFFQPEQIKASYILIKVEPEWNEAKKMDAKKKIEDVRKKALAGQDFASLARTYSDDLTASRGGDLGYVRKGQILKPLEEALFVLKPGEVSDVVETRLGYNLIKAVERKPETAVPFEDVKDRLRTALKHEKGQQEANAYIAKVRDKASVKTFLPAEE